MTECIGRVRTPSRPIRSFAMPSSRQDAGNQGQGRCGGPAAVLVVCAVVLWVAAYTDASAGLAGLPSLALGSGILPE